MKQVAEGVWQIALMPRNGINAYVVGDVLVDAGMKGSAKKIVKALGGHAVSTFALTHAHIDHAGGLPKLQAQLQLDTAVGAADAEAVTTGKAVAAKAFMKPVGSFPAGRVDRTVSEGDSIGGFQVLDTPGHSPGHISLWRASDRVLICGDVWTNMNLLTTKVGLHTPPGVATPDPAQNRTSQQKLAALEPETVLFGHGPPLTGAAPKLKAFVEKG